MKAVSTPTDVHRSETGAPRRWPGLLRTERRRWLALVVLGCLLLAALDAWWVVTQRHGYPLDIDEAGYTSFGLIDYYGLHYHGLSGWWEAMENEAPHAPLLPAVTAFAQVLNSGILAGFMVLIVFAILLVFACYGIGERLAGPRLGALAALAVGTSEGLFGFGREYIFALPTATFLACSVYALLRSDGLRGRWWSIACGACLGLMLLSRTMSIAFVPGVLLAACLSGFMRGREELGNRSINFVLLVVTGVAVGATWYLKNLHKVIDYLTNYGYGSHSKYYGAEHALISWGRFKDVADRMMVSDLLAPMSLLLFVGLIAGGVMLARRLLDAEDRRGELTKVLAADWLIVLIVFVVGFAGLMSSRNGGNGFTFPLAVLLPTLAVLALRGARRAVVVPVVVLVAAIAALNTFATSDISESTAQVRTVDVPLFGYIPWVDGRPNAVLRIREQISGPATHFDEHDKAWLKLDNQLADILLKPIGRGKTQPVVVMGSRHRVFNTNTITLAAVLKYHAGIPFIQLEAEPTDTIANYLREIRESPFDEPSVFITTSTEAGDFPPVVSQPKAEAVARRLGFKVARRYRLPDGRQARVWMKRS
jgi:hypothetical protein